MVEDKTMEILLAQTNKNEVEEILNFINMLDPYEKREFIGIMKGAKLVKSLQATSQKIIAI